MADTIVVPVDIARSEDVHPPIGLAARLAADSGADLVLLHVVQSIPHYVAMNIPAELLGKAREHARDALLEIARKHGLPDTTKVAIREGHAGHEILEFAKECDASLIVIASHDPGFSTYWLGSVAAHVVRHAHCSVYVVREPSR